MELKLEDINKNFRGLAYYNSNKMENILIGGCGGIGSNTAFNISRSINCNLFLVDFDTVEPHNIGSQFYTLNSVGKTKTEELSSILKDFTLSQITPITTDIKFLLTVPPIVIAAFDNIKARRILFKKWREVKDREIFIDGRLQATYYEMYCVMPGQEDFYEETLYDDSKDAKIACTVKQTSHFGQLLGARITQALTNYLTNKNLGIDINKIPFCVKEYGDLFKIDVTWKPTK